MTSYSYKTEKVCVREICFEIEDGKLHNVRFFGGCPGNTQAVAKLDEGHDAREVAGLLKGNDCAGKGTSCADQLAKAIDEAISKAVC